MERLFQITKPLRLALLAIALGFALGCDTGSSPVAPTDTVITVQANPSRITVTGSSAITVTVLHLSGQPVRTGTEIRLRTDLGTIENLVLTDANGIARATLTADGRDGETTITAESGVTKTPDSLMPNHGTARVIIGTATPATLEAKFDAVTSESLSVFFDDLSTGEPTSWSWNFGDGNGSTEQEPTHRYREAGTYDVTLMVRDADGEDSHREPVTVPRSQGSATTPNAIFTFMEFDDRTLLFTDSSENVPTTWRWEFGDGGTSSQRNPSHRYSAIGVFPVTLTVSNGAGNSSTSKAVEVFGPLEAGFSFTVTDRTVVFSDSSRGKPDPDGYAWDFGDGASSEAPNPSHVYAEAGAFVVSLTVTRTKASTGQATSALSQTVTVE